MPALPECVLVYSARHGDVMRCCNEAKLSAASFECPFAWGCFGGKRLLPKTPDPPRVKSQLFCCKKSAENVLHWNFDAGRASDGFAHRFRREPAGVPRFERHPTEHRTFAQSKKS